MQPDPIEQLLRDADEAAARPQMPADLPARVRHRLQRRQRRRQVGAGAAAIVVLVLAAALVRTGLSKRATDAIVKTPIPKSAPDSQSDLQAELQLAMGDLRTRALDELDQMAKAAKARTASLGLPDPAEVVDQQLEQAARLIVYQADRLNRDMNLPAEAIRSYRSAIELFPATRAAQTARARLEEMNASRGDRT